MSLLIIVIMAATALAISTVFTYRFCRPDSVVYILDHPNERSLHDRPVPRGGGLAILIAIGVCGAAMALIYPARGIEGIGLGVLIVAVVSYIDDRHSITAAGRFAAHVVAAVVIIYSGFFIHELEIPSMNWGWPPIAGAVLSAAFIVWMINLYNFMDGMDGFAGGMAVIGFGTFAFMGWTAGHDAFLAASLIIAAASAGFLFFNFPPARIFMGDVGSSTLGFLAAAFSLWGVRDGIFPFWIAFLVFSPFIVDATITLFRRLLRGDKIWQAHKTHYYQRLVQAGWGHRRTVLVEYAIMLGCAITSLWSMRASVQIQLTVFTGWAVAYLLFFFWVGRLAVRGNKAETL
jgi:UDP-N-acetylmuramyl pentapeptide phosphotransferase/UDP-N-acetylglucosamine-1-phosphate transferase